VTTPDQPKRVVWHSARSWAGTEIEDACPCPKAPCGFVVGLQPFGGACDQHTVVKTIRQSHRAEDCPGPNADQAAYERGVAEGLRRAATAVRAQANLPDLVHFDRPSDFRKGVLTCLAALESLTKPAQEAPDA
jgi:hypothetical protein